MPVILDGENCWEYFPDGGVGFLRNLYQQAARDQDLHPVTVGEFLEEHPPKDTLGRLFSGSWISHNFAIWIGHEEDNKGWDALHETRRFLVRETQAGIHDEAILARAWEEMYIAEGSDWFWWYGDDHSSALDGLFDHLFRKHLRNVYALLGADPPGLLFEPISRAGDRRVLHDQPTSFLRVRVDGKASYFEWLHAARYTCGNDRGTMTLVTQGPLRQVWFGFNSERLLIRVDTMARAREDLVEADRLRIGFVDPADWEILVEHPSTPRPIATIRHAGELSSNGTTVEVATDRILELAAPFARLGLEPGAPIRFYVELLQGDTSLDRAPREGIFELTVPTADFERIMWQV